MGWCEKAEGKGLSKIGLCILKVMGDKKTTPSENNELIAKKEMFLIFSLNLKDIEYGEEAKRLDKELGWSENVYYNVISLYFWITFSFAMHEI